MVGALIPAALRNVLTNETATGMRARATALPEL
jgi:hypothetical protein